MTVPVWFLDIDGVVNALSRPTPDGYRMAMVETMRHEWPIRWRTEVVDFINRASREGLVEVRWLTTWEQNARTSLAPALGLDEFVSYDIPDSDSPSGWWKADIVAEFIASESRPFLWTDDDLKTEDVVFLREDLALDHLVICPDLSIGLNDSDLASIHGMIHQSSNVEGEPHDQSKS